MENRSSSSKRKKNRTRKGKSFEQEIFKDWCKACGICASFCPKGVIKRNEAGEPVIAAPEKCSGCRVCELRCPDFAISIKEKEK